ncbi:MAG: PH domain-containing protein [Patescibacteria group bacterium]
MAHQNTKIDKNDPAFLYLDLHEGEDIYMIIRHHWAGFLGTLAIVLVMGLVPLSMLLAINTALKGTITTHGDLIILLFSGYFLFLLTFLFGAWINYYYDIIFITNERIINVDQEGLLARKTSELSIHQVQNVSADVAGFLQSIFDYGVLVVETAGGGTSDDPTKPGKQGYFTIIAVPDPNKVARLILDLHRLADEKEVE